MLKVWNLSLIIIAFSLTIFGTFLTRSGILSSIHAFSSGPVGSRLSGFSFVRSARFLRSPGVPGRSFKGQPELDSMVSRESAFLLNNIVLVSALFTIFLGTIFPLLSEAIAGTQVSVGAPYFNSVTVPLFLSWSFLWGWTDDRLAARLLGQPQTEFSLAGSGLAVGWRRLVYLEGPRFLPLLALHCSPSSALQSFTIPH